MSILRKFFVIFVGVILILLSPLSGALIKNTPVRLELKCKQGDQNVSSRNFPGFPNSFYVLETIGVHYSGWKEELDNKPMECLGNKKRVEMVEHSSVVGPVEVEKMIKNWNVHLSTDGRGLNQPLKVKVSCSFTATVNKEGYIIGEHNVNDIEEPRVFGCGFGDDITIEFESPVDESGSYKYIAWVTRFDLENKFEKVDIKKHIKEQYVLVIKEGDFESDQFDSNQSREDVSEDEPFLGGRRNICPSCSCGSCSPCCPKCGEKHCCCSVCTLL